MIVATLVISNSKYSFIAYQKHKANVLRRRVSPCFHLVKIKWLTHELQRLLYFVRDCNVGGAHGYTDLGLDVMLPKES